MHVCIISFGALWWENPYRRRIYTSQSANVDADPRLRLAFFNIENHKTGEISPRQYGIRGLYQYTYAHYLK